MQQYTDLQLFRCGKHNVFRAGNTSLALAHLGNVLVDAEGPANMLLAPTVDRCHHSRPPLLDQRRGPHGRRGARRLPPTATSGPRRFRGTLGCLYERLHEEYMALSMVMC